jgi:hypothetical protein
MTELLFMWRYRIVLVEILLASLACRLRSEIVAAPVEFFDERLFPPCAHSGFDLTGAGTTHFVSDLGQLGDEFPDRESRGKFHRRFVRDDGQTPCLVIFSRRFS